MEKIVLASKSPRRKKMLTQLFNNAVEIFPAENEKEVSEESSGGYVEKKALNKAVQVSKKRPYKYVIAADTIIEKNGKIYGKPKNKQEAFNFLSEFSNDFHHVYTGVSVVNREEKIKDVFYQYTEIEFSYLSKDMIKFYINTEKVLDKAGGYGIQDLGGILVRRINGDYFNVVGFPVNLFFKKYFKLIKSYF